ncbi:MAG: DUF58 domain-containing protein [Pseudomonadota bacterium]
MRMAFIPSRRGVQAFALLGLGCLAALAAGVAVAAVGAVAVALALGGLLAMALDVWLSRRAWNRSPLELTHRLPAAFALGVPATVTVLLANPGPRRWDAVLFDEADPAFAFDGMPQRVRVEAASEAVLRYRVTAQRRGLVHLGAAQLRVRGLGGGIELLVTLGQPRPLRVYPNFAALMRYAWLAGDQRLAQIGVKTYAQRGLGTDFRQLADYLPGDPVRHIDWKASLRQGKPIVRQYQDDRDQCVFFLLDCGRRMRADEASGAGSHFDQLLNAMMLLSYVALKDGDEVGALTFGQPPGGQRRFAPRKGLASLNALMNRLHDVEPSLAHSDYLLAAQELLRVQRKRALVVLLTNFRGEDVAELRPALQLLRTRHLVIVASLREQVLDAIAAQPLRQAQAPAEAAAAHLLMQQRRDAFRQVADTLSVDATPRELGAALVNRYHAVKRAGML